MNVNIEKIIAQTIAGEANGNDQAKLRQWINASQANKETYQKIILAAQLTSTKTDVQKRSDAFSRISSRIEHENSVKNTKKWTIGIRYWMSAAAVAIILITTAVVLSMFDKKQDSIAAIQSQVITKSNPAGQKSKIHLPDGSIVWLNSKSELTYEENFNDSMRNVNLRGEAFFEVIKDPNRPFIVHTGNVSTTAVGTAFNIETTESGEITVSLTSGIVNVEASNSDGKSDLVQLRPGQGAFYNSGNSNEFELISINPEYVTQWKDGILRLQNASLNHTIRKLESWYNVQFTLKNQPIRKWDANGVFDNEYLENVLHSLSFSQGFEYEINGKNILLTFKE